MQVPAPFEYERASSLEHALDLLERYGDGARVIAGGHSLLPMMKLRLARPDRVVDINDLAAELGFVDVAESEVRIGAMTRHRELLESDVLARVLPIFRDAERVIADPVVRNRGTIGGSLCQADPAEDLSAVCTTLGAQCVVQGRSGTRTVPMEDFYRGPFETAVGTGELLVEVRIPLRAHGSSAYEKVERRAGDWAVVSAGAAVWLDGSVISDARVGLAAVGPNTTGIAAVSEFLRGEEPTDDVLARAGEIAAEHCSPAADLRGSEEYKRHLASELTRRALRRAVDRIREEGR
jgi:aerobic carbon-monoxide dehydrogenase medium subunit